LSEALRAKESSGRDNNFNLLRIVAAGAVLVSHAYPISLGPDTPEPLDRVLGMSLGTLAVLTFFAISGYFISQSYYNKRSIVDFVVARALRIFPGLITVLILTVLILGPAFTKYSLAAYFSDHETLLYIPRNLRLWPMQYALPGVFVDNAFPEIINGSLWTLAYEVVCYTMVAVVGMLVSVLNHRRFIGFLVAYAVCYVVVFQLLNSNHAHFLQKPQLLSFPFVIGMALFQFRKQVPLRLPILVVLGTASVISYGNPLFHELFVLAWSYGVFYLGFLRYQRLLAYNRLGDYSYGMYIYAFPVGQIIAALYKGCTPAVMIASSLPLTLLFAILSWHFIEERALAQRSSVSTWLKGRIMLLSTRS
jgi:peptidoglycan/LPS O-acetylase OafA/YrhL